MLHSSTFKKCSDNTSFSVLAMNDLLQSMELTGAGQYSSTDHLEGPDDPVSPSGSCHMKELAYSTTAIDYTTLRSKHRLKNKGTAAFTLPLA